MHGEEGVALVLALVFLVVVGLFATVALDKNASTTLVGGQVRDRTQVQYALDGGVDRALQQLRSEMASGMPTSCTSPTSGSGSGTLTANGTTAAWTCSTLAGRAALTGEAAARNYAVVVTSSSDGAFRTQSGTSQDLQVGGSVFLNGAVDNGDVGKPVEITEGDLVRPNGPNCQAGLDALTKVRLIGTGQLRSCTEQTLTQSLPVVVLPSAPPVASALPAVLTGGTLVTSGSNQCRVYYPGRYAAPPLLTNNSKNYFVSGLYYFAAAPWVIDDANIEVIGGQRSATTDTTVPANACSAMGMDDAKAMSQAAVLPLLGSVAPYRFAYGVTWVFGSNARLDVRKGAVTLFSPPTGGSSVPVNIVGASSYTDSSYAAQVVGAPLLTGGGNNSAMQVNAKIFAPNGDVEVFSTNGTVAAARGGVVAHSLELKASAVGSDALAISASSGAGTPPPPFRTVLVEATDASSGTTARQRSVATVSNYAPYSIDVKSWRSQ